MEIKMYMSPNCPWSKRAMEWFAKNGLPFQELNVTESDNYRDELLEKSNQMGTPVIDVDGEVIVGFNESELMRAVGKAK